MGDMENCAKDCNAALEINPTAIKPLVRRAAAYEAMEKYVTMTNFHFLNFHKKSCDICCHVYSGIITHNLHICRYRKAYQDYRQVLYLDRTLDVANLGLNRYVVFLFFFST